MYTYSAQHKQQYHPDDVYAFFAKSREINAILGFGGGGVEISIRSTERKTQTHYRDDRPRSFYSIEVGQFYPQMHKMQNVLNPLLQNCLLAAYAETPLVK